MINIGGFDLQERFNFPPNFIWGTATSAYQIEGNNFNNDWYEFDSIPENTVNGETAGISTDHWNRFMEDFDFLQQLNVNSYRMSIEWSRIFPKRGEIDYSVINHYRKMLQDLKRRKINVMLNLYHFTLPLWFVKSGGLLDKENITNFEEYTEIVCKELGQDVDIWCTMNEPMVVAIVGFYMGSFPPKEKSLRKAITVARNLFKMHASSYHILKEQYPDKMVGFVKSTPVFQALESNIGDRLRAKYADYMYTGGPFKAIKSGKLPLSLIKQYKYLKKSTDYIGINYYSRTLVSKKYFPEVYHGAEPNVNPEYLCTGLGWAPYPQGLYLQLKRFGKMFPNTPLFVTENGIGTNNDTWRQYNIIAHLLEVYRAIQEGFNVIGYHYWSLLDNFEWTHGYSSRFGLIHVDYQNSYLRTLKDSGRLFAKICKENGFTRSQIEDCKKKFPNIPESMKIQPVDQN